MTLKEIVEETKNGQLPYYIYILHKPDGVPFYVGKGKIQTKQQYRVAYHEDEAKNGHRWKNPHRNQLKLNTIRKIWKDGGNVGYSIDSWYNTLEAVNEREVKLIATIGRRITGEGPLANISEGGEGYNKSPETIQQISDGLKKYYATHPEAIQKMSESGKKRFENPEAREHARQVSIQNNSAQHIIKWLKEKPEEMLEKMSHHGERMKTWYAQNPEEAEALAGRRNKVLRSEEHRAKMADRTREYIKNNPEGDKKRRDKVRAIFKAKNVIHIECIRLLGERLNLQGEPSSKSLYEWKKAGKIPDELIPPNGQSSLHVLEDYHQKLKSLTI